MQIYFSDPVGLHVFRIICMAKELWGILLFYVYFIPQYHSHIRHNTFWFMLGKL